MLCIAEPLVGIERERIVYAVERLAGIQWV